MYVCLHICMYGNIYICTLFVRFIRRLALDWRPRRWSVCPAQRGWGILPWETAADIPALLPVLPSRGDRLPEATGSERTVRVRPAYDDEAAEKSGQDYLQEQGRRCTCCIFHCILLSYLFIRNCVVMSYYSDTAAFSGASSQECILFVCHPWCDQCHVGILQGQNVCPGDH